MIKKNLFILYLLPSLFFISGCTGAEELNIQAIVTAMGFDKGENGTFQTHFQVVYPGGTAAKQGSGPEGGPGSTVYTYTINATSMINAVDKARNLLPRKLFFPHIQAIVFGEEFARDIGFSTVVDYLERDNEVRDEFMVFTAKDSKAIEILSVYTALTANPGIGLVDRVKNTASPMGLKEGVYMEDIVRWTYGHERDAVTMGVRKGIPESQADSQEILKTIIANENAFDLTGIPLFKGEKLVDWYTLKESKGWALIDDQAKETLFINTDCPDKTGTLGFLLKDLRSKKDAIVKGSDVSFLVKVTGRGVLREVTCDVSLEDPKELEKLSDAISKQMSLYMHNAVKKAKENEVDSFGFGNYLYKNHPKDWKKIKDNWMDVYLASSFETDINIEISGIGTRRKSTHESTKLPNQ